MENLAEGGDYVRSGAALLSNTLIGDPAKAVVGELRAGFAVGRSGPDNERTLREFLMEEGVEILWADEMTTYHYGTLYRQLRLQGTPIPTNDLWIAALTLRHNLVLYARDHHFDHLPQLSRI